MTNQIKAALIVAGILLIGIVVTIIGTYLPWYVLPSIVLTYFVYIMYQLVLTKLNVDAKVSEIK